uniref:Uncharacterized protein n=1 Tax=Branchiostoma floridae TaxID=7739 RepID=C3YF63_BRAFL|eukprot:XP_002605055.1 hypothetical protein BRAFLDRAFT_85201 [Branchiostoma floridae]
MASLADRLLQLQLCLKEGEDPEVSYGRALRDAIVRMDPATEMEVLKSLGDLHLQRGRVSRSPAEFDRAAGLYAAVLKRSTNPDMRQTLVHRLRYTEKLSNNLYHNYSPNIQSLLFNGKRSHNDSILRVATIFNNLDLEAAKRGGRLTKEKYTETLVTAIATGDELLAVEALKSLGDWYLEEGRRRSDVSQLGKATAMYNKALTRCEGKQQRQTLQHRVAYTERVGEAVARRSAQTKGPKEDRGWTDITPSVQVDSNIEESWEPEFTDHMRKGNMSLQKAELQTSEKHFAAALKLLHQKAQQYQREVEPLYKLGDVYSKRGQQTGDGGDFVKAAALYNAAIARSKDEVTKSKIEMSCKEVERSFLKELIGTDKCLAHDGTAKHKKQLKEMRDQIKLEMETIDQQLDPYVHDEDDPCVKEIEAKRAQAVRHLFEKISQERIWFISLLVEECISVMGPSPCKYALIGLGSQATGLVTPYSDLEFAILVEEEVESNLIYFKQLTHFLHLKVVNLGETILPAVGIKSLNDFYSENPLEDNWYYDSVTPRGFAFDGSMPKASKTPLGRQGTSELIRTPTNMATLVQKDFTHYLDKGYHLASILRNPCLMVGDQDLVDEYEGIVVGLLKADGGKMAMLEAKDTLRENMGRYEKQELTAKLTDVKKEIYRFPSMIVEVIALSAGIVPTCSTIWQTIEEMERKSVVSFVNGHHLRVLVSISAELRLRTYIANGGQKENLSALSSLETSQGANIGESKMMENVFYVSSQKQLFSTYMDQMLHTMTLQPYSQPGTALPEIGDHKKAVAKYEQALQMYDRIYGKGKAHASVADTLNNLAQVSEDLGDHRKAFSCYKQAIQIYRTVYGTPHPQIALLLNNIGGALLDLGDYRKALIHFEEALDMDRTVYGQHAAHPAIAGTLNNLGNTWHYLDDNKKAISYHEQAMLIWQKMYGQGRGHPNIASTLGKLGGAWQDLGDHRKALSYHEKALKTLRNFYGQHAVQEDIATSLNNLGLVTKDLGDTRGAISYFEQALQMLKTIYGPRTAHHHIATSYNNLGTAWKDLGEHWRGIFYHEQALQTLKSIYGQDAEHPAIAVSLNGLGLSYQELGDYEKAISCHEKSLQIFRKIHHSPHNLIACSLNSLGTAWFHLGDNEKAVTYHQQALQMQRCIYGESHPDIAISLDDLALAMQGQGHNRETMISYQEQALEMRRSIYGRGTAHPDIAASLNNLGASWNSLGDPQKAISCFEQAVHMYRSIYGKSAIHPHIAKALGNLGTLSHNMGDHKKALLYNEQALDILKCIHGQNAQHPEIATVLNSLGRAYYSLDNFEKAIKYQEAALQMKRRIYGQKPHPNVVSSLTNLGNCLFHKLNYKKAISYYEEALEMMGEIGQSSFKHHILLIMNNLGCCWVRTGEHQKAVDYLEQAIEMGELCYGQRTPHSDIALLLNSLAEAWHSLGNHRKSLEYQQQALQMYRAIYGQDTAHPTISTVLNNLGCTWEELADYRKAKSFYQEALDMANQLYQSANRHHHTILNPSRSLERLRRKCPQW